MKVVIDGIIYVPVLESHPDAKAIAKGLLKCFWGDFDDKDLDEKMEDIYVRVYDDGKGIPIQEVLKNIVDEMGKGS